MGAKRTVFGTYGGKLKNVSITELQTVAAKAALASGNVKPEAVDSVIVGIVGSVSIYFFSNCIWPSKMFLSLKKEPFPHCNIFCTKRFLHSVAGLPDLLFSKRVSYFSN